MSITSENAKQIRSMMEVHVSLSANVAGAYASVESSGRAKVVRSAVTDQTDISAWPWRKIADFQGDGFPLDGTCQLWDGDTTDSPNKGVVGIRSTVGASMMYVFARVSDTDTTGLTLRFNSEGGTVEVDGVSYDIRETVIVPVTGYGGMAYMYFYPADEYHRVELISMTPGVFLSLDNDDLTSCTLALRSDLNPEKPSFPVSEIEVRAYWPNDISDELSTIDEGTPLSYYAGYPGSYSTVRHFYISEPITMEQKEFVIKAVDSADRLDSYRVALQARYIKTSEARRSIYTFFRNTIRSCGIDPVSTQAVPPIDEPPAYVTVSEEVLVLRERSAREYVQSIMNLARPDLYDADFWPTFVDAGIPRITWSKPTAKWTIYEADCGEVRREIGKPVVALKTEDEKGVDPTAVKNDVMWTPIFNDGEGLELLENAPGICGDALKVTADKQVIRNFDLEETGYFWSYKYSGQTVTRVWSRINSISFIPSKTSRKTGTGDNEKWTNKVKVLGKELRIGNGHNPYVSYAGVRGKTIEVEPCVYGAATAKIQYAVQTIYPAYDTLFSRSHISGSFLWKGDPRMQPRDVFNFRRLDGSVETCTIESIELKHEGGGTTATISYRLGVV